MGRSVGGSSWRTCPLCFTAFLTPQSKGKYEVMVGTYKSAAEMVELYVDLINKYPSIIALIDPFRKEVSRAHLFCLRTYILHGIKYAFSPSTFYNKAE